MKYIVSIFFLIYSFNSFAASKVLVTVNGSEITQAAVENFMLHVKKSISFKEALGEMITIETLASYRLEKPIAPDSTLQLELDRNRKAIIAANTLESFLSSFKMSEEALNAEYEKLYLTSAARQEYNANHILLKSEDEALKIIQSLNDNANFEELAKLYSTGPSGKTGGALGWFTFEKMVKPFSEATAILNKGQHTQTPTKTQFGWHVIKLNDIRKKPAPTLESVTAKIKRRYSALMLSAEINKLHKTAEIIVNSQ